MRIAGVVLILFFLSSSASAGAPISVKLGTIADGYSVKIEVNRVTIPFISGGGSETIQLFSIDHPEKSKTVPMWYPLFCLYPGRNAIKIQYKLTNPKKATPLLQFNMKSSAYKVDVFNFKPKDKKSGTIEAVFEIYDVMPKGYTTQHLKTKP